MPKRIPIDIAEALITAVQKRECLYNTRNPGYKNRNVSELAWKDAADEVERDVPFCKATWASLRCIFNRNLASIKKEASGSRAERQPKWHFFQQMLFLKDHVSQGQMAGDLTLNGQDANGGSSSNIHPDNHQSQVLVLGVDDNQSTLNSLSDTPRSSTPLEEVETGTAVFTDVDPTPNMAIAPSNPASIAGTKRKEPPEDPVQQAVLDYIATKVEEDEDMAFLRGLLPFFKNLPRIKKIKFMHHVTGFLLELYDETQ